MRFAIQLSLRTGAVVILASALAPFSQAQQSSTTAPRTGRVDALQLELGRQYEQQMIERALAQPNARTRGNLPLSLAEFRSDFLKLQVVNNRLMKSVSSSDPLDLKLIAESTGEIRKLGKRLKANLLLPKTTGASPDSQLEAGPGLAQLRMSLSTLDKLIVEFVSNPLFESAKVVDAELAARAWRDLDEIILLSRQLSQLGKPGQK